MKPWVGEAPICTITDKVSGNYHTGSCTATSTFTTWKPKPKNTNLFAWKIVLQATDKNCVTINPQKYHPRSRFQYCRHLLKNIVARLLVLFTAFSQRWPVLRIISCTKFTPKISDIGNKFFLFLCFHSVGQSQFHFRLGWYLVKQVL